MPRTLLPFAMLVAVAACGGSGGKADGGGTGGAGGQAAGGTGGTGGGGVGGSAGSQTDGGLGECMQCTATPECAVGLECGHQTGSTVDFCVDPFAMTECCAGTGGNATCYTVEGSMLSATQCPSAKPATQDACQRQTRCLYGQPPFRTPCVCTNGAWQCYECPSNRPTGACPGADGQLCPYGNVQCSCQAPDTSTPVTWHCNVCPTDLPSGACAGNDYCGYAPSTTCVCADTGTWACIGPA